MSSIILFLKHLLGVCVFKHDVTAILKSYVILHLLKILLKHMDVDMDCVWETASPTLF